MFERGPNGYWFEWTLVDESIFLILGLSMAIYGIHLIFFRQDKFDFLAPIIGIFLWLPGMVMFFGTIMSLFGVAM